jgi:hypothetical protein
MIQLPPTQSAPKPGRVPSVGDVVHFYERRYGRRLAGPYAALVTRVDEWPVNRHGEVDLAVLGDGALRFVPLVPFDDAGARTGQWWTWRPASNEAIRDML